MFFIMEGNVKNKILAIVLLVCFLCLSACSEKTSMEKYLESEGTKIATSKPEKLVNKNYDDLTNSEKEQLKYFNDGYTLMGELTKDAFEWVLYKYGEKFKVINAEKFLNENLERFQEAYLASNMVRNYVVINNILYFFISETKDVYAIDLDNPTIEQYIDGSQFENYAIYDNSIMLKHKNKLVFICTCEEWDNVIEVDTDNTIPKLEYKGRCSHFITPSSEYTDFNFVPIDDDNYRITEYGEDIVHNFNAYSSYNLSLKDYNITDVVEFPEIEFDEKNTWDYIDEKPIGYFYRDNKDVLFSFINKNEVNQISGLDEWSVTILKSDSDKNKEVVHKKLENFKISESETSEYKARLKDSKLSNDWLFFETDDDDLFYFFDSDTLCDARNYVIDYVDLWNVYYTGYKGSEKIFKSKPINDFKKNIYHCEIEM